MFLRALLGTVSFCTWVVTYSLPRIFDAGTRGIRATEYLYWRVVTTSVTVASFLYVFNLQIGCGGLEAARGAGDEEAGGGIARFGSRVLLWA
jgi:hypothetical protein